MAWFQGPGAESTPRGANTIRFVDILIRRDSEEFGPLSPEDVERGLADGTVLGTDQAWFDGLPNWGDIRTVLALAAAVPKDREPPQGPKAPPAARAQLARLRELGVPEDTLRGLNREQADYLIAKGERLSPATPDLLARLAACALPCDPGMSIAEARDKLEAFERDVHAAALRERGIPFTDAITAVEAAALLEFGPATEKQRAHAEELGLLLSRNIDSRSAEYRLVEAEKLEASLVAEWHAWLPRGPGIYGVTPLQVRDVIRYLHGNHPGWRNDDPGKKFLIYLAKFNPQIGTGRA